MIIRSYPLHSIFLKGCFFLSIALPYINISPSDAEQKSWFPEILEQAGKIVCLKERIAEARKETSLLYYTIGRGMFDFETNVGWRARSVRDRLIKDVKAAFPELKGFNARKLYHMRILAKTHTDQAFIEEVLIQLPWSHVEAILSRVSGRNGQLFYIKKHKELGWSRETLIEQIKSNLHRREGIMEDDLVDEPVVETKPNADIASLNAEGELKLSQIVEKVGMLEVIQKSIAAIHEELTWIYHAIGRHIIAFRATHRWPMLRVLNQLTKELKSAFPGLKGLSGRHIQNIRKFAEAYPDEVAVKEIVARLSWSHIASIIERTRGKEEQLFYIKKVREHGWSCATLVKQIKSGLYAQEQEALAGQPVQEGQDTSPVTAQNNE